MGNVRKSTRWWQTRSAGARIGGIYEVEFTLDDYKMSERPFFPDKADSKKFCLAIGIGAWALAIVDLVSPPPTAPTGRWSWLIRPIYELFGAYGLAVLYFVAGCILVGISLKRGD